MRVPGSRVVCPVAGLKISLTFVVPPRSLRPETMTTRPSGIVTGVGYQRPTDMLGRRS